MANEITVNVSLTASNGFHSLARAVTGLYADQATKGMIHNIQTIGTSAETLAMGDIGTAGWCLFRNLDATNFITLGPDTGGAAQATLIKLLPGEPSIMRLGTSVIYATADTAECKLEYIILET